MANKASNDSLKVQPIIDIKKCVLIKSYDKHDEKQLLVGYQAWLGQENLANLDSIVNDATKVKISWPTDVNVNATKTFIKKSQNLKFHKKLVVILKAGDWQSCSEDLKNLKCFSTTRNKRKPAFTLNLHDSDNYKVDPPKRRRQSPTEKKKKDEWSDEKLKEELELVEKIAEESQKNSFDYEKQDFEDEESLDQRLAQSASRSNAQNGRNLQKLSNSSGEPQFPPFGSDINDRLFRTHTEKEEHKSIEEVTNELLDVPEKKSESPKKNDQEEKYETDEEEDDSMGDDETEVKNLMLTIEEKDNNIRNLKKELFNKDSLINKLYAKIDLLQKSNKEKEKIIEKLESQLQSNSTNNMSIVLENLTKIKTLADIALNASDAGTIRQGDALFQNEEQLESLQSFRSTSDLSSKPFSKSSMVKKEEKHKKKSKDRLSPKIDFGDMPVIDTDYVLTKKDLINVPHDPMNKSIREFCNSILNNLFSPEVFASSSPLGKPFKGDKETIVRPALDQSKMNAALNLCYKLYWKMYGGGCRNHLLACARHKCSGARRSKSGVVN